MNRLIGAVLATFVTLGTLVGQSPHSPAQVDLPTGKHLIIPVPGHAQRLNGFPVTIALTPDKRYAAILNDGYGSQANQARQSIIMIDLKTNELTDFPESRLPEEAHQSYFIGLAFSGDGAHLYASIGSVSDPQGLRTPDTGNGIAVYSSHQGKLSWERFIKIPLQKLAPEKRVALGLRKGSTDSGNPYPAGIAVISKPGEPDRLLVANNLSDNIILIDSSTGQLLQQFDVSTHEIVPSTFPYTCVALKNGERAWCSLWNASQVVELNLQSGTIRRWIPLLKPGDSTAPGSHPTALLLSRDEKKLYAALSNADKIAMLSTESGKVTALLDTTVPGQNFPATTPTALAQSEDGRYLFATDSSINAVAVFATNASQEETVPSTEVKAIGFIPTEWYPCALATIGDDLLIATAKGQGTGPNNGPDMASGRRHRKHPYIATMLYGSVSRINFRSAEKHLPELTRQVEDSNLVNSNPVSFHFQSGSNPIRHVIYILKENRTYDQIFGDLNVGNGDPSLTMYGADITPNEHKLALQFGVVDNFYDSGEVSGDGHDWSTAAITSDYNEKTWQIGYRSRERTYDYGGMVADESPLDEGEPDIDAPATGYIWDNLAKHELSYRAYGDYVGTVWCKASRSGTHSPKEGTPSPLSSQCSKPRVQKGEALPPNVGQPHGSLSEWPWAIPMFASAKATKSALRGHTDLSYPNFNTDYPDQLRTDEFLNEFEQFAGSRLSGKGEQLPSFVLLYLPNDHTHGTSSGAPSPAASVSDNDLAVGRVVDAVSHSVYWDDTAIFIVEDDAQDGADHVDAHRSIALAISKYSPGSIEHPFVDSGFYTTVNMMHTIEALLRMTPMNQNDGYAPLMAPLFSGPGNQPAFTADWSNRDNGLIYKMNPGRGEDAQVSSKMDFSRPDVNNPAILNAILWRERKGGSPVPKSKHAIFAGKD